MRDPFSWSIPLPSLFGIVIRVHVLMPVFMLAMVLWAACDKDTFPGAWADVAVLMIMLFLAVLLHELGHCYAARRVDGDASEVLLWPLGGLARVDVPHTAYANFVTAAGGPAVNLILCLLCGVALAFVDVNHSVRPYLHPFYAPVRSAADGSVGYLVSWGGDPIGPTNSIAVLLLVRFFWVNWMLMLLNIVLLGIPLDGGRMLQAALWPSFGYRQATLYAIYAGFACMFITLFGALVLNMALPICLAIYIYVSCKQEWIILETGGEESLFGYDFSQGYTSLERDEPPPPKQKKLNFVQRWLKERAAKKAQREMEQTAAEEQRMDELLQKIQSHGKESLSDEEQRFLKRVADRYKRKSP